MNFFVEVFGFLDVLLRGIANAGQAMVLGGVIYLLAVARPFAAEGEDGARLERKLRRVIAWSAGVLAVVEAMVLTLKGLVLIGTVDVTLAQAAGAGFVVAGALRSAAAIAIAALCLTGARRAAPLLAAAAVIVLAGMINNHSAARLDNRAPLMIAAILHQVAAAAWIGAIPYFLITLARSSTWLPAARRFSLICIAAVATLLAAGLFKSWFYIAEPAGIWGTAYGAMTATKALLFAVLLVLGALNYLALRRAGAGAPEALMTRRRAEIELALGLAVFFAAASMTSIPPAIDLPDDRVTLAEIAERLTPRWPHLTSPSHAALSIQVIQQRLNAEAQTTGNPAARAYVPGAGIPTPTNPEDILWSEYNHHWAGAFVFLIGLLSLLERTGRAPWARNWPLLFIGLAIFLLIRSDPRGWPLGDIGFFEVMRDPEALQHRVFISLIAVFGIFEWAVRTGRITNQRAALVFPVFSLLGAGFLLAHSHAIANVKEELLVELTHLPIAILGLATGAARWYELRVPENRRAVPAMIWPICFVAVGLMLLTYRES